MSRLINRFCLFVLSATFSVASQSASLDLPDRILRAERFEDWDLIVKLYPDFQVRDPSDLPALTAVLDACVLRNCRRNPLTALRGPMASSNLLEFANSWIEFSACNPLRAKDRFNKLAVTPQHAWLGYYGLLRYSIESDNANLLQSTITGSERFRNVKLISDTIHDARVHLALLTNDYEELQKLLGVVGQERESQLLGRIDYLIWKNDLTQASNVIDQYIYRFGYDHNIAATEIELKIILFAPRDVIVEIEKR